jgi:hypothetical protein
MFVDDTGIEPVTPTMSMWCSTAEPIVRSLKFTSVEIPTDRNHPLRVQYHLHQNMFRFGLR